MDVDVELRWAVPVQRAITAEDSEITSFGDHRRKSKNNRLTAMDKSNSTRYRPTNVGVRREEGIKLFQHRLARLYHHFDWPTAVQPSRDMGTIQKNNSQIYPSIGGLDQREPARMHRSIRLLVQRKNVSIVTLSKHHHHVIMMT